MLLFDMSSNNIVDIYINLNQQLMRNKVALLLALAAAVLSLATPSQKKEFFKILTSGSSITSVK